MKEQTVTNRINASHVATTGKGLINKIIYYLKNGQALYWGSFFILILIEFILGGQLSGMLTKDNYALYANVLNTLPFYNVVVNLGLSYGIIYIIAYNPGIKFQLFRQSIQLQTVWYLILVGAHVALFFIFRNAWVQSLLITVIISYTYSYRINIGSLFLATRSYTKAALANVLQKVSLITAFIIIYYTGSLRASLNDRFSVIYPSLELGMVLLFFIVFWHTNRMALAAPKINYRKRILKYGKYSMFNNALNLLNYSIIAFIIRAVHIDISLQIIFLLCIIFFRYTGVAITPVFSIMTPLFTAIKNDTAKVKAMYKKYYALIFIISLLTLVAFRFFFGFIITHFYAKAYWALPGYFNFFCYLIPFFFINAYNSSMMAAIGRIKFTFLVEVISTIILVLFFVGNLLLPIVDYHVFYYIVLTHLAVKFLIQTYGTYREVNK